MMCRDLLGLCYLRGSSSLLALLGQLRGATNEGGHAIAISYGMYSFRIACDPDPESTRMLQTLRRVESRYSYKRVFDQRNDLTALDNGTKPRDTHPRHSRYNLCLPPGVMGC